ncbi:hypothetical protein H5410_043586 [Solanum commersonii]|uniref:Uncharacterized protein n=1 Tax=Solanum commersonii TaxID=4109 RepID=A0A9J5Y0N2_SOLCO|nr:hypothetical protein H5410_043586 [Solanum commersonii]
MWLKILLFPLMVNLKDTVEGFVQNIESGRLMEETSEGYLMDLIHSNVVMVSKRKYNGKVKNGQAHDVVLHFCLERSR